MSEQSPPAGDHQEEQTPSWHKLIGVAVLLACGGAAGLVAIQVYPSKLPVSTNPSFVDDIFDSRVVILLIRVALIFAAGYVVISVVGLIAGRRWLAELGPFRASEPIATLEHGAEALERDLNDARGTVESLKQSLFESGRALVEARSYIEFLVDRVDTTRAEKEGK